MKNREKAKSVIFIVLSILIGISGCSKNTKKDETNVPNSPSIEENTLGDSDSGKALGLKTIHFLFDSDLLDTEAKSELKSNSQILSQKPTAKIQIEGHCDQRGGVQYNIALGERRANSVKHYLTDLGISSERITTISYGKERPLDRAESEKAYAKNRRANFVITSRN
jgi:peptidoglycan-associated lipoprotein